MIDHREILAWTIHRFDYYLSGRTLWFCGQMQTGTMMLAYAIEAHLKQMLSREKKCPQKLKYSHDIPMLFEKSREFGLFTDVEVSEDLLRFAQDNFHRRYPSQTRDTQKNAMSVGHALGMTIGAIAAYDDFILQLDQSVSRALNDLRASIALMGAKSVAAVTGQFIWHSNYAMLELWEDLMKMFDEDFTLFLKREHESIHEMNRQDYLRKRTILAEKDKLLVSDGISVILGRQQNTRYFRGIAKTFKYPGRYFELPDGSSISIVS